MPLIRGWRAIEQRHLADLQQCLSSDKTVLCQTSSDRQGLGLLHFAAQTAWTEAVLVMLEAGADVALEDELDRQPHSIMQQSKMPPIVYKRWLRQVRM